MSTDNPQKQVESQLITEVKTEAKPDHPLFYAWRVLTTGFCWAVFGIGGLMLSLTYFPYLNLTEKDKDRRIARARLAITKSFRFFRWCCEKLWVAKFDTQQVARIRQVKGAIIIANHPTILDYVLICSELPGMDCLVKAELMHNFFLKGVVKAADYLLNNASEAFVDECKSRLERGENVLIFPEGTRTVPGTPIKLKRGVAHVALRVGCPLEVIHIDSPSGWLSKASHWYEIPKSVPTIHMTYQGVIKPQSFMKPDSDSYSLASRHLTREMTQYLSNGEKIE